MYGYIYIYKYTCYTFFPNIQNENQPVHMLHNVYILYKLVISMLVIQSNPASGTMWARELSTKPTGKKLKKNKIKNNLLHAYYVGRSTSTKPTGKNKLKRNLAHNTTLISARQTHLPSNYSTTAPPTRPPPRAAPL
jgi:hypothetical protein